MEKIECINCKAEMKIINVILNYYWCSECGTCLAQNDIAPKEVWYKPGYFLISENKLKG